MAKTKVHLLFPGEPKPDCGVRANVVTTTIFPSHVTCSRCQVLYAMFLKRNKEIVAAESDSFFVKVKGETFHCTSKDCGANMFHRVDEQRVGCNGCSAVYFHVLET